MTLAPPIVFLVDVDNTLLDNDGIQQDLKDHLDRTYGVAARARYWRILEELFAELGYRDYIGALQRFRVEHPREVELLAMSSFLMDYPFRRAALPERPGGAGAAAQSRPDRDPVGWRYRLPAPQSRTCRSGQGRGRGRANLRPQRRGAERRRAALPGRALRSCGRQIAHPERGQAGLGRARDDGVPAPGPLCARRRSDQRLTAGGRDDRAYRRLARL